MKTTNLNGGRPNEPSARRRFGLWWIVMLLGLVGLAGAGGHAQSPTASVDFQALDQAVNQGVSQGKVIAVMFTAKWCGWCQKMYASTFTDPRVVALSRQFAWTSVDTDQQPEIAARFGVRSLPLMMWFNMHGELLDSQAGYISPQAMESKLRQLADKARTPGQTRQRLTTIADAMTKISRSDTEDQLTRGVREMVEQVAGPNRSIRSAATRTLASKGDAALEALVGCLDDPALSIRAAANDLLAQLTEHSVGFDPFAAPTRRAGKIKAWRDWLNQRNQPEATPEQPDETLPPTPPSNGASPTPATTTGNPEDADQ